MIVAVDPASTVPPFEQLRLQISGLIGGGTLPRGTRLPSVRQLAADLGLAAGTVARAYRELEDAGYVETRGRHGTTVLGAQAMPPTRERDERIGAAAATFVAAARALGATNDEIRTHLDRHLTTAR